MSTTMIPSSSPSFPNVPLLGVNAQDEDHFLGVKEDDHYDLPPKEDDHYDLPPSDPSTWAPPARMPSLTLSPPSPISSSPAGPTVSRDPLLMDAQSLSSPPAGPTISRRSLATVYASGTVMVSSETLMLSSETVMVYGYKRCLYKEICAAMATFPQIRRIYDCTLGDETDTFMGTSFKTKDYRERLDGTRIYQVTSGLASKYNENSSDMKRSWGRVCKAALANIILENLKSIKNGRPITPIIFCIALKNNLPPTSAEILAKTIIKSTTLQEIRRLEKLANDRRIDPDIRAMTLITAHFVEVEEVSTVTADGRVEIEYVLTKIAPPWENPEFAVHLRARQAISDRRPKPPKEWRRQLNLEAAKIRGPADGSGLLQVHPHTGPRLESAAGSQITPARCCVLL